MKQQLKYQIYPSLLDSYQNFLNSEDTWLKFWGNSDTPSITLEDFEQRQFQGLIDKINRVPMKWEDSEKADRGTAFNEIVDCIILNKKSDKMHIYNLYETTTIGTGKPFQKVVAIKAEYNKREFQFPLHVCREFSNYFKGAQSQVYCEAVLPTKYGDVKLYGYIDELMPTSIHDIKVTGSYEAWKFKKGFQHIVYPYCLNANRNNVTDFEYNILLINEKKDGNSYQILTEYYNYIPERDISRLTDLVEDFIDFIEQHKELITDLKIFNKH